MAEAWKIRTKSRRGVFLIAPLVLVVCCGGGIRPEAESDAVHLVVDVPATDQRPYTLSLPEGWSVEETVHSDGSSFVLPPPDERGEVLGGGKVFGVVKPSGRIVPFFPAPGTEQVAALEAKGSQVSVTDGISVDGHPAWEAVISRKDPPHLTVMTVVDVGAGAGFKIILTVADGANGADLLRDIVASIRINEAQLDLALAEASPPAT
jgi:hypothetical protein